MHARLNPGFGWQWKNEDGSLGPFVLSDVERYAGMVSGKAPDGRKCARPLGEFDALSLDGVEWKPFFELRETIPWENHVHQEVLHLPGDGPGATGANIPDALEGDLHLA